MNKIYVVMTRRANSRRLGVYIKEFDNIDKLAWFVTRPENKGRILRYHGLSKRLDVQLMRKVFSLSTKS